MTLSVVLICFIFLIHYLEVELSCLAHMQPIYEVNELAGSGAKVFGTYATHI